MPALRAEKPVSETQLREALGKVGKQKREDEINCGGCGYNTCREFARALIQGKAEVNMCVSYLRQLAERKADRLLNSMPSGVVIVDRELEIMECNYNFARLLGEDAELLYESRPGMTGASLKKLFPFWQDFESILEGGADVPHQDFKWNEKVLNGSLFLIEKDSIAGGIFQDVTLPWIQKDRVIQQTRQVLQKNVETVQQIAYLLGENAAESEGILNSIIESFSGDRR